MLRGPGGAAFTTFTEIAITSKRLMGFSKKICILSHLLGFKKWSMVIFTKYYWVSRESNFFNCWGDNLVIKQVNYNNFATTEQIFKKISRNMRPMQGWYKFAWIFKNYLPPPVNLRPISTYFTFRRYPRRSAFDTIVTNWYPRDFLRKWKCFES